MEKGLGIKQCLGIVLRYILYTFAIVIPMMIIGEIWNIPVKEAGIMMVGSMLVNVWLISFLKKRYEVNFKKECSKVSIGIIGVIVILAISQSIVSTNAAMWDGGWHFFEASINMEELLEGAIEQPLWEAIDAILALIAAIILAPITEELIYRGVIFKGLSNRYSIVVGFLVSTTIFTLVHGTTTIQHFLGMFLAACVFTGVYMLTGSLRASIICHMVYNTFLLVSAMIAFAWEDNLFARVDQTELLYNPYIMIVAIVGIIGGMLYLYRDFKQRKLVWLTDQTEYEEV